MRSEDKHCTPEQSEKLTKLGVRTKCFTFWMMFQEYVLESGFFIDEDDDLRRSKDGNRFIWDWLRAYDTPELMEMLPLSIDADTIAGAEDDWYNEIYKVYGGYTVGYRSRFGNDEYLFCVEKTNLAEALADCLIWLIENNHVKSELLTIGD